MTKHQTIELLSPAKNIETAKQAILHGADAVYIGGPQFGARHNAGNSLQDIESLMQFAHLFYAKVYVTLNTILHDNELNLAQTLITQLYEIGVDALIIQDMGILMLDIPPIDLHASTQMDIRTTEKAKFLADVGFSQLVVARELSLPDVTDIAAKTDATIEYFIHGALCVAFSGQCYISHAQTGRSANRGDCSQACRLPYTLKDEQGQIIAHQKHLLSMKDNNQSEHLFELINAGVRSFKIEGRYKDVGYVKNVTAFYRQKLDAILSERADLNAASSGRVEYQFIPDAARSFNRGSTDYFIRGRQYDIGAFDSPKSIGMPIGKVLSVNKSTIDIETSQTLHNGDGLNLLIDREMVGFSVNNVEKIAEHCFRIFPNEMPKDIHLAIPPMRINRNFDHQWQQRLLKESSKRKIKIDIIAHFSKEMLSLVATCREGNAQIIRVHLDINDTFAIADKPEQAKESVIKGLSKLGQTIYRANNVTINGDLMPFIPSAQLNQIRRDLIDTLTNERLKSRQRNERKSESNSKPIYPHSALSFLANVYNQKAKAFYYDHGVELIENAYEAHEVKDNAPLMITKHCLRYSFKLCPKQVFKETGAKIKATPLSLLNNNEQLTLKFNCKPCEMEVWGKIKKSILKQSLAGSE